MLKTTAPDTPMAKAKQAAETPAPTPTPTPTPASPEPQPRAHEPQSMPALAPQAMAPAETPQSPESHTPEPSPTPTAPASAQPQGKEQPSLRAAKKSTGKSTGKNKSVGSSSRSSKSKKGKFRETLWFKKGDLDAAAAAAAAQKAQQTGDALAADKADSLPMDERYEDDGSVSQEDRQQHSLRTGNTEMMQAISADDVRRSMEVDGGVTEEDLIADMQAGRQKIIIAVVIGLLVVIGVIAFLAT
jgi:hypothetical protein